MELKVWVDRVVRVVCGLSEETSCQDVVIALAQAIGQTGRYVLVQTLRDTERQLRANERPLELLFRLGQRVGEVHFSLRRIGPSHGGGPTLDSGSHQPRQFQPEKKPQKCKQPNKKSPTVNLRPADLPRTKLKQPKKPPRDSPPSVAPVSATSKQELLRKVLQQQVRLQALEAELEALEREVLTWERPLAPEHPLLEGLLSPEASGGAEPEHVRHLEEALRAETKRELAWRRRLAELHSTLDDCGSRLSRVNAHSGQLEQEILQERLEESLGTVRVELQCQQQQGAELEASLIDMERALGSTQAVLQAKSKEMDELNKELHQCNLQQFIQQTGVPPTTFSKCPHKQPKHLDLAHPLPDGYSKGIAQIAMELAPRFTTKRFL